MTNFFASKVTANTTYVSNLGYAHGHYRSPSLTHFVSRFPKTVKNFICYTNRDQITERKYLASIGFLSWNTQKDTDYLKVHYISKENFENFLQKSGEKVSSTNSRFTVGEVFYRVKIDSGWYRSAVVTKIWDNGEVDFRLMNGRTCTLKPVFNNGHNQDVYNVRRKPPRK